MTFHAETLSGHGLLVTMRDPSNRIVSSTVVKGKFTERNLVRLQWNSNGLNFVRKTIQRTLQFCSAR